LSKGNKVKVEIVLRGREKAHQSLAKENIEKFLDSLETPYRTEEEIKKFPSGFNTIIAPE
jgi:translation initiation factor IF-3